MEGLDLNIEKVAEAICNAEAHGTPTYPEYIGAYGADCRAAIKYRKMAMAAIDADSRFPGGDREMRTLRWKLKTLGKQLGRAGHTIHQLRAEVAYARNATSISPGDYQRNLERMREAEQRVSELQDENSLLKKQLHQAQVEYGFPSAISV